MTTLLEAGGVAIASRIAPTDLSLRSGTMTALIGPNGGGKTSLLRAIARIESSEGKVWIDDQDLDETPPARRRQLLSYLPASRDIVWPISARDLIALGLSEQRPEQVRQLLEELELEALADRPADRLSTGERTRVLLGRALVSRPRLLLLDEPLSNLDPYWVLRLLQLLRCRAEEGSAVLVAIHDLALLERFDRALLVASGRLLADAKPEAVLDHPEFEAAFRVRRDQGSWSINPEADRRSSR